MKNPRSVLFCFILWIHSGRVSALNSFECLRDLLPVTEMAFIIKQRHGQEHPFFKDDFMVIPETARGRVIGFYLYDANTAAHYQNVSELDGSKVRSLNSLADGTHYRLIVQPKSLAVVTIDFQPGYKPFAAKELYNIPEPQSDAPILRLKAPTPPESKETMMKPLLNELHLRESWIRNNNVDMQDFKDLNRVMQTTCRSSVDASENSPAPPQK